MKFKGNTHQASLSTAIAKLERDEPFTSTEEIDYDVKEQNLIRLIQLRNKTDKINAINSFDNYKSEGRRAVKRLSSSLRKYTNTYYPKHGKVSHEVEEFETPIKMKRTQIIKENKIKTRKFLLNKNNKFKNEITYNRVSSASKKYPNASVQELRHGVNSKWSQNYRVKHGLTRNYK
jgi:hypothetical protein